MLNYYYEGVQVRSLTMLDVDLKPRVMQISHCLIIMLFPQIPYFTECLTGWESLIKTGVERVSFSDTLIEASSGDVNAVSETSNYHMYGADSKPIDSGK